MGVGHGGFERKEKEKERGRKKKKKRKEKEKKKKQEREKGMNTFLSLVTIDPEHVTPCQLPDGQGSPSI